MSGGMASGQTSLSGQVAFVTGGGRGLGRAFALALASAGATVAVCARSEEQLAETVRLIEDAGGRAVALPADLSDPAAIEPVTAAVERQLGPVDLLVNNAGVSGPAGPEWEVAPDQWWHTLEVNLRAPFLCARAVLPGMIARRRGRIINVSSNTGNDALPLLSAYGSSKAALTYFSTCLAGAVQEYGIIVFAYGPGLVHTAMSTHTSTSPDVPKAVREPIRKRFEEGSDVPLARSVERFLFLVSGQADALSGRFISTYDDPADLLARIEEIKRDDLYTLHLRS